MYRVKFTDNTEFIGGKIPNSRWNEMPPTPILEWYYPLGKNTILLRGFAMYNHEFEIIEVPGFGKVLGNIILSGYFPGHGIFKVVIDTRTGQIKRELSQDDYKKTTGWKEGKIGVPQYKLLI